MIEFLRHLFDPSEPPTAAQGGALSTPSGWFHFASDMSIFFTYAVICTLLMIFLFGRRNLQSRGTIWMIWLFLLACGITRLVAATTLYYPVFRLFLVVKVATAGISIATVIAVARVFPSMMMETRTRSEPGRSESQTPESSGDEDFVGRRDQLEQRASQLTVRDRRIRKALDSSATAVCSWDIETGRIYWEVGIKALFPDASEDSEPTHAWSELLAQPELARLQSAARQAAASSEELQLDLPLAGANGREGTLRIRARADAGSSLGKSAFTGLVTLISAGVPA